MNNLYLLLIAVLVLFSWVGNIYTLTLPDGSMLPNLLSEEGVRWLVRHSLDNIASAPFAEVLLVLIMVGALRGSRLLDVLTRRVRLITRRDRYAFRTALAVFLVGVCSVGIGLLPGGNLLGVTGYVAGGPFSNGWLFLLALLVCLPSMIYGWMSGRCRGEREIFVGMASEVASYADCLVTLVVASQLVAIMRYVCLFDLLGMSHGMREGVVAIVYFVPLIVSFITKNFIHDTSSTE